MFIDTGMKTEYTEDICSICNIILHPNTSYYILFLPENLPHLKRDKTLCNTSQPKHPNTSIRSFVINWRLCITGVSRTFDWVHHALSGDSFTKANYNHEQKQTLIPVNKCYIA